MRDALSQPELKQLRAQLRAIYQRLEEFGAMKTAERLAERGKLRPAPSASKRR